MFWWIFCKNGRVPQPKPKEEKPKNQKPLSNPKIYLKHEKSCEMDINYYNLINISDHNLN